MATRRQVLKAGAAGGAGLAMGSTSALMEALADTAPACGTLNDIEHIVIFIQENRSFDHYFGRYKGVRGFDDRSVRLGPGDDGTQVFRQAYPASPGIAGAPNPLSPFHLDTALQPGRFEGDCTNDILHQWVDMHDMWNDGKLDRFVARHLVDDPSASGRFAAATMGYYQGSPARDHSGDIDLYWALADNFTLCDGYHASVIGGTDINRLYSITGTMDPDAWDGGLQFLDTKLATIQAPGADLGTKGLWKPYPQVLQEAGVSWKIYSTPDGHAGDNVLRYFPQFRPVGGNPAFVPPAFASNAFPADFVADALAGRLPQVSWLLANLTDTEHAPAPLEWGQDVSHTILTALFQSPQWAKTALFITYDEGGGFFDHVPPPVPLDTADRPGEFMDISKLGPTAKTEAGAFAAKPIGLGFRVPLLVVSPFTRNPDPTGAPMVCSDTFDHTSLLRFVERRFGVRIPRRDPGRQIPGLSPWRERVSGDLTSAFNFAAGSRTSTPTLPQTNRADPRVLAECPAPTGTLANPQFDMGYQVPAQTPMPTQERAVQPLRPSGVCAATTSTIPGPPSPSPGASSPPLPATDRGAQSELPAVLGLTAGAALIAATWWRRRQASGPAPPSADS